MSLSATCTTICRATGTVHFGTLSGCSPAECQRSPGPLETAHLGAGRTHGADPLRPGCANAVSGCPRDPAATAFEPAAGSRRPSEPGISPAIVRKEGTGDGT